MVFSWYVLGSELVRLIISTSVSLVLGGFLFRKYISPPLMESLEEAQKVIKKVAALGGIKKADMVSNQELSRAVTTDLVKSQIPELELARVMLSPSTWEQIDEALETNPAGVMELWEKYGDYFKKNSDGQELKTKYDF
jgi:hypothetical protein